MLGTGELPRRGPAAQRAAGLLLQSLSLVAPSPRGLWLVLLLSGHHSTHPTAALLAEFSWSRLQKWRVGVHLPEVHLTFTVSF